VSSVGSNVSIPIENGRDAVDVWTIGLSIGFYAPAGLSPPHQRFTVRFRDRTAAEAMKSVNVPQLQLNYGVCPHNYERL
jgi:hypothetical protein